MAVGCRVQLLLMICLLQAVAIINFVLKPDLCELGMLTGKGAALRAKAQESKVAAAAVQTSARRSALGGPHTGGETSSGCDRIVLEDLTAVVVELREMHCGRLDEISKSLYNYIMTPVETQPCQEKICGIIR